MERSTTLDNSYKEDKKELLDDYMGFISNHFKTIAKIVNDYFNSRGFKITKESWFLIMLIIFILIHSKYPLFANWSLFSLGTLLILNLVYPNYPLLRKTFFKTSEEVLKEILEETNSSNLSLLKNFVSTRDELTIKELNLLFKRKFNQNYEAYYILFNKTKISDEGINWLIKQGFFKQPFVDDILIIKLIKSCSENISYNSYINLSKKLQTKKLQKKTMRFFYCKYIKYSNQKILLKRIALFSKTVLLPLRKFLFILIIIEIGYVYLMAFFFTILSKSGSINNLINTLAPWFAYTVIALLLIHLVEYSTMYILNFFIKGELS